MTEDNNINIVGNTIDKATIVRVDRLEKDVCKLQANDEDKSKVLSAMDKASGKAEVYQEQILSNLASITASVAETLRKATATEALAFNLKVVTDKQTVDMLAMSEEVSATKKKITKLEMLPAENANKTKWILITILLGNGVGLIAIVVNAIKKYFAGN